jgi:hypothetical protein
VIPDNETVLLSASDCLAKAIKLVQSARDIANALERTDADTELDYGMFDVEAAMALKVLRTLRFATDGARDIEYAKRIAGLVLA